MSKTMSIILYISLLCLSCSQTPSIEKNGEVTTKVQTANSLITRSQHYKSLHNFRNDTLSYIIYNFIDNKGSFIDKPITGVLNKLELPIVSYNPSFNKKPNTREVSGVHLRFESEVSERGKLDAKKMPNSVLIILKQPIDYEKALTIIRSKNRDWEGTPKDFYQNARVQDIILIGSVNKYTPR